jgi:TRAP-type C4-dicarboxylate transport system substrate-binding protein
VGRILCYGILGVFTIQFTHIRYSVLKEVPMKRLARFLVMLFILGFFGLPSLNTYAAEQRGIKLVFSTFFPASNVQAQLGDLWAREIEKRTSGKVEIMYLPGWPVLKGEEIYEGTLIGATDIGMSAFAYNHGLFPAMEAVDLPLGYPSASVATSVINDFYAQYRPKELADVKVLYLHAHGPGLLHSIKPVYKLEDLRGMRIRCTGFAAKMVRAMGAEPLVKAQGYTYALLQDRYVTATWGPMEVLKGWKQAEVIKYTTECYCIGYTSGFYVAMNVKKWKSLPSDVQKVFEEVSSQWIAKHAKAWDESDGEGRKFTLSLGNKIIPLSREESARWCKAVEPVVDEYINRAGTKGLPGKEYVKTLRELVKKYWKR